MFTYKVKTVWDKLNTHSHVKFSLESNKKKSTVKTQFKKKLSPTNKNKSKGIQNRIVPQILFKRGEKLYYKTHFKNDIKWLPALYIREESPTTIVIKV